MIIVTRVVLSTDTQPAAVYQIMSLKLFVHTVEPDTPNYIKTPL